MNRPADADRRRVDRRIVALAEIAQIFQSTENAEGRIVRTLELLKEIVPYDRCSVAIRRGDEAQIVAVPKGAADEKQRVAKLAAALRGDLEGEDAGRAPGASHLALPLVAGDEDQGVILVERDGGVVYDELSLRLLSVVTSQLAAYLAYCHAVSDLETQMGIVATSNDFQQLLVGIVSHDLRNPLAAVLTGTSILTQGVQSERDQKVLALMSRSARRAVGIISDLLDMTRGRTSGAFPITPRSADAAAVTRELVEETRLAYPTREIAMTGADREITATFDPDRLGQGLGNLLANAIQHGAANSAVEVSISDTEEEIVFAVKNHGPPIGPETLSYMFEPFRRGRRVPSGRPPQQGLGLGLYIVEQIAKAHGGRTMVTSSEAAGTEFRLEIPRHPATAE